jgi:hypothetical protein
MSRGKSFGGYIAFYKLALGFNSKKEKAVQAAA